MLRYVDAWTAESSSFLPISLTLLFPSTLVARKLSLFCFRRKTHKFGWCKVFPVLVYARITSLFLLLVCILFFFFFSFFFPSKYYISTLLFISTSWSTGLFASKWILYIPTFSDFVISFSGLKTLTLCCKIDREVKVGIQIVVTFLFIFKYL